MKRRSCARAVWRRLGLVVVAALASALCIAPVIAEIPVCGVGATKDAQQTGFDLVTWWDNPTVGWTIACKSWAPGYTPVNYDDAQQSPEVTTVATGSCVVDIDESATVDFWVWDWLKDRFPSGSTTISYMYRNRNNTTGTAIRYSFSARLTRDEV